MDLGLFYWIDLHSLSLLLGGEEGRFSVSVRVRVRGLG